MKRFYEIKNTKVAIYQQAANCKDFDKNTVITTKINRFLSGRTYLFFQNQLCYIDYFILVSLKQQQFKSSSYDTNNTAH